MVAVNAPTNPMPVSMRPVATTLPAPVVKILSPKPTVVTVTTAHRSPSALGAGSAGLVPDQVTLQGDEKALDPVEIQRQAGQLDGDKWLCVIHRGEHITPAVRVLNRDVERGGLLGNPQKADIVRVRRKSHVG